ncbi:MAG: aromatic ring-hydroxylating dioxygenase subunit alpha [Roseovarius sp.]
MLDKTVRQAEWQKPLTENPGTSHTLPARCYIDPEYYRQDVEQIFYKTWQYVGHKSQFANPGDYVTAKIADQNIVVIRNKTGELQGFHNVCKHRAHELLSGEGNIKNVIVCPYHAWTYDLDGKLRSGPYLSRMEEFDRGEVRLSPVRVEWLGPFVFANLDPDAVPLEEIAGDMLADMRAKVDWLDDELEIRGSYVAGLKEGQKSDWKVTIENFLECYHCRVVHPAWADMTDMDKYEGGIYGYWATQFATEIKHDNKAYQIDPNAPMQKGLFWTLWPNISFNFMPGERSLIVNIVHPLGHERSDFSGHIMYPPGEVENTSRVEYASQVLGMEDLHICESVQRGLHSLGFDQGRIVATDLCHGTEEHAVHWLHWLINGVYEGQGAYPPLPEAWKRAPAR